MYFRPLRNLFETLVLLNCCAIHSNPWHLALSINQRSVQIKHARILINHIISPLPWLFLVLLIQLSVLTDGCCYSGYIIKIHSVDLFIKRKWFQGENSTQPTKDNVASVLQLGSPGLQWETLSRCGSFLKFLRYLLLLANYLCWTYWQGWEWDTAASPPTWFTLYLLTFTGLPLSVCQLTSPDKPVLDFLFAKGSLFILIRKQALSFTQTIMWLPNLNVWSIPGVKLPLDLIWSEHIHNALIKVCFVSLHISLLRSSPTCQQLHRGFVKFCVGPIVFIVQHYFDFIILSRLMNCNSWSDALPCSALNAFATWKQFVSSNTLS